MRYEKGLKFTLLYSIVFYFQAGSSYLLATDETKPSKQVELFFKSFYNCLFRFHLGSDLEAEEFWSEYFHVLEFYSSQSPFIILDQNTTMNTIWYRRIARKYRPVRKFSNCDVQLHLKQQLADISETQDKYQRPEYVWFLISSNETEEERDEKFFMGILNVGALANLGYPTMFFVIFEYQSVQLLCLSCAKGDKMPTVMVNETNNDYRALWNIHHKTLHRTPIKINVNLRRRTSVDQWDCNIHKGYVVGVDLCSNLAIINVLNVSTIHNRSPLLRRIVTHGSLYAGMLIMRTNTQWITTGNFEILVYGYNAEPYGYILVMNDAPSNFLAIIQPFDWKTWIYLALSTLLVASILSIKNWASATGITGHEASHVWFSTMGTLLDQPVTNLSYIEKKSAAFMLWSLWSFVALSLSQAYKGTLFSFLSNTPSPSIPETLDAIVNSKLAVLTQISMTTTLTNEATGAVVQKVNSILKDGILKDTLVHRRMTVTATDNSVYEKFYQNLEWIGGSVGSATASIMTDHSVYNSDLNTTIEIPSSFFFVDQLGHTGLFKSHLLFFTQKWVSKVLPLPVFMSRASWTVKENYLSGRIKFVMSRLYESGLYERWDKFFKMDDIVYYIKEAAAKLIMAENRNVTNPWDFHKYNMKGKQNELSLKTLFHFVYMNSRKELPFSGTLPHKVYSVVMMYALMCLAVACLFFAAEVVTEKISPQVI